MKAAAQHARRMALALGVMLSACGTSGYEHCKQNCREFSVLCGALFLGAARQQDRPPGAEALLCLPNPCYNSCGNALNQERRDNDQRKKDSGQ